jgi:hypothetical protein
MGLIPDFGGQPVGCQGKIDFLFVIESWYAMKDSRTSSRRRSRPSRT